MSIEKPSESFVRLYSALRSLAAKKYGHEVSSPTALVHDAYCSLFEDPARAPAVNDTRHMVNLCALKMMHIVVDRARSRNSQKNGGMSTIVGGDALDLAVDRFPAKLDGLTVDVVDDALSEYLATHGVKNADLRAFFILALFAGVPRDTAAEAVGITQNEGKYHLQAFRAKLRKLADTMDSDDSF